MRPPDPKHLRWLKPWFISAAQFEKTRENLATVLQTPALPEVYTVNTRSIYRVTDPNFGSIGIKEMRFETRRKRLSASTYFRHRALCEFNAATCFASRGGDTPALFAGAIEVKAGVIFRVFLFLKWLDDAITLSDAVRTWNSEEREREIPRVARALVDHASRGLVHGRHSSENILFLEPSRYCVIDFSHAQIFAGFHSAGFMRDVGRIAARLIHEKSCARDTAADLLDEVYRLGPSGLLDRSWMDVEFERILQESKKRQRKRRDGDTRWRGLPGRLQRGP